MNVKKFQKIIWAYYKNHKRYFPWRRTRDPYKILISEVMLQQTQASRVIPRYKSFLKKFPTVQALASSTLRQVLVEWQGLGYNRRAIFLKRCAERIESDFQGKFPKDFKTLCSLPGIGPGLTQTGLVQCINEVNQTTGIGLPKTFIARAILDMSTLL